MKMCSPIDLKPIYKLFKLLKVVYFTRPVKSKIY